MNKKEILAEVQIIFREIFEKPTLVVHEELTADDVDNWDSLTHVSLILAIEEKFGINFALAELKQLKNVGALLGLLEQKLKA